MSAPVRFARFMLYFNKINLVIPANKVAKINIRVINITNSEDPSTPRILVMYEMIL